MSTPIETKRDWILRLTERSTLAETFTDPNVEGFGNSVGATAVGVWFRNAIFTYPVSTGEAVEIVSTSANDTAAGTGMRTCRFHYLTSDGLPASIDFTLNGLGAVAGVLTNVAWPIEAYGLTFGSLGRAAGTISVRTVAAAIVIEEVAIGMRRSLSARRRVPAGESWVIFGFDANSMNAALALFAHTYDGKNADGTHRFLSTTRGVAALGLAAGFPDYRPIEPPLWLPAGTLIEVLAARAGSTNAAVNVRLDAARIVGLQP